MSLHRPRRTFHPGTGSNSSPFLTGSSQRTFSATTAQRGNRTSAPTRVKGTLSSQSRELQNVQQPRITGLLGTIGLGNVATSGRHISLSSSRHTPQRRSADRPDFRSRPFHPIDLSGDVIMEAPDVGLQALAYGTYDDLCRQCVGCGLDTGCFCDGLPARGFYPAADRVPSENCAPGQPTPLCTACSSQQGC